MTIKRLSGQPRVKKGPGKAFALLWVSFLGTLGEAAVFDRPVWPLLSARLLGMLGRWRVLTRSGRIEGTREGGRGKGAAPALTASSPGRGRNTGGEQPDGTAVWKDLII